MASQVSSTIISHSRSELRRSHCTQISLRESSCVPEVPEQTSADSFALGLCPLRDFLVCIVYTSWAYVDEHAEAAKLWSECVGHPSEYGRDVVICSSEQSYYLSLLVPK